MIIAVGVVAAALLLVVLFLLLAGGMLDNIGRQQIGVVERRYFGKPLPEGRVVALPG